MKAPNTKHQIPKKSQRPKSKQQKGKRRSGIGKSGAADRHTMRAQGYELWQFAPGKFWLNCPDGTGMETSEGKIATMLKEFYLREF